MSIYYYFRGKQTEACSSKTSLGTTPNGPVWILMSVLTLYLCSGKPWLWLDIEGPVQQSDIVGSALTLSYILNHIIKELQTLLSMCKYCDLCVEYQGCTPLQVFQCSKSTRVPRKYSQCSFEVLNTFCSIMFGHCDYWDWYDGA